MEYIEIQTWDKEYLGKIIYKDGEILAEGISETYQRGFEEDIRLWTENGKRRGLKTNREIFHKIPVMTSNWSRIFFSNVKKEEE